MDARRFSYITTSHHQQQQLVAAEERDGDVVTSLCSPIYWYCEWQAVVLFSVFDFDVADNETNAQVRRGTCNVHWRYLLKSASATSSATSLICLFIYLFI